MHEHDVDDSNEAEGRMLLIPPFDDCWQSKNVRPPIQWHDTPDSSHDDPMYDEDSACFSAQDDEWR